MLKANHKETMKISAKRYGKGFTLVELLVVIAIIVALAAIAAPMAFQQLKKAAMTTAVSNGKQIGQALINFDQDYGNFPDVDSAGRLPGNVTGSVGSSNAALRQLIQARILDTESVFYAKIGGGIIPVDNQIGANQAIAPRENAWSYVLNQDNTGLSTASNSQLPVLMTPVVSASAYTFAADPFAAKAVVIRINNSADTIPIGDGGQVNANALFPQIIDANGLPIDSRTIVTTIQPDGVTLQN